MILLTLGVMVAWMIGMAIGLVWDWEVAAAAGAEGSKPAWIMLIFPPLAAWLTAEAINLVTPRRLFDRRTVAPVRKAALGFLGGVIGFALAVAFLPIVEEQLPDWGVLASASAVGTMLPVVLLPRVRRGFCAYCDYDMKTLPSMERCPECGNTGVL